MFLTMYWPPRVSVSGNKGDAQQRNAVAGHPGREAKIEAVKASAQSEHRGRLMLLPPAGMWSILCPCAWTGHYRTDR